MTAPVALPVFGIIAGSAGLLDEAERAVAGRFGPAGQRSADIPFDFTDYYGPEMGPGLVRRWVAARDLVPADRLAGLKLGAGLLEDGFRVDGRRRVNIDPGLLSLHSLVLASTKDHAHRVYLRDGIYAELTLVYKSGEFHALDWTYPDYKAAACLEFLAACRRDLLAALAAATAGS